MSFLPISPAGRRYGLFRDNPAHPARVLRALHIDSTVVLPPTAMELCAYKGPTRNQGNEGSCTGQAGAAKVDLDYRQFSDWLDRTIAPASFEASAEFIYICNLIADGDLGTDAGQLLVGSIQLLVGLTEGGTLRGNNLCWAGGGTMMQSHEDQHLYHNWHRNGIQKWKKP